MFILLFIYLYCYFAVYVGELDYVHILVTAHPLAKLKNTLFIVFKC